MVVDAADGQPVSSGCGSGDCSPRTDVVKNRYCKQFGIELGQLLQRRVVDDGKCVVKLSQPHLFRAGGVVEHIGEQLYRSSIW